MSRKIAFIGAGSFGFTRELVKDLLTYPALQDAELSLMDIDAERLDYIKRACDRIVAEGKYPTKIVATLDRAEALKGADGVVTTILQGNCDIWQHDILIPKKYGVDTNVGDTRGPSGIFRFLRTVNPILDIAADIERLCPDAVYLNYTNPMAMLCRAVQGAHPGLVCSGLCHSVQGTAGMLAQWIGAKPEEITYTCAGINHQAFYTEFLWKGKDAYPLIRKAIEEREEVYNQEIVRNEMFLALGYYVEVREYIHRALVFVQVGAQRVVIIVRHPQPVLLAQLFRLGQNGGRSFAEGHARRRLGSHAPYRHKAADIAYDPLFVRVDPLAYTLAYVHY